MVSVLRIGQSLVRISLFFQFTHPKPRTIVPYALSRVLTATCALEKLAAYIIRMKRVFGPEDEERLLDNNDECECDKMTGLNCEESSF